MFISGTEDAVETAKMEIKKNVTILLSEYEYKVLVKNRAVNNQCWAGSAVPGPRPTLYNHLSCWPWPLGSSGHGQQLNCRLTD